MKFKIISNGVLKSLGELIVAILLVPMCLGQLLSSSIKVVVALIDEMVATLETIGRFFERKINKIGEEKEDK